jgi:hypothetical protein
MRSQHLIMRSQLLIMRSQLLIMRSQLLIMHSQLRTTDSQRSKDLLPGHLQHAPRTTHPEVSGIKQALADAPVQRFGKGRSWLWHSSRLTQLAGEAFGPWPKRPVLR